MRKGKTRRDKTRRGSKRKRNNRDLNETFTFCFFSNGITNLNQAVPRTVDNCDWKLQSRVFKY